MKIAYANEAYWDFSAIYSNNMFARILFKNPRISYHKLLAAL
jgi:hypothetical protein